ncbi:MAG: UDP-3-O-acyl-N-acetylglucosamine deacetylase [Labilithrix sp.]|nr:UDP-3-O-acyl-N-acetylglucosamine deacetylase [Labilithrix sp.]
MIAGQGLHTGKPSVVRLAKRSGDVALLRDGRAIPLSAMRVVDTTRSTVIADLEGHVRIGTVEHLFAALAALGLHRGVAIEIDGAEPPLADGGARVFLDAARALDVAPSEASLRVARDGDVSVGESVYAFRAGAGVAVEVAIDFGDARLDRVARWDGDPEDFRVRIATARTFGFEHEVEELLARGLASHVSPESVVVIGRDRVLSSGAPFAADEPARHKLLDLVGDMYVHGGPPRGFVRAIRPGHAATHEAVRRALAEGLLTRT